MRAPRTLVIVARLAALGIPAGVKAHAVGTVAPTVIVLVTVVLLVRYLLVDHGYGWGDGGCPRCLGFGKAYYGTGAGTYRDRCDECGGSGSGVSGPVTERSTISLT